MSKTGQLEKIDFLQNSWRAPIFSDFALFFDSIIVLYQKIHNYTWMPSIYPNTPMKLEIQLIIFSLIQDNIHF